VNRLLRFLTDRLGVLTSWSSTLRVAGWVVVWLVVVNLVISPARPNPDDRDHVADAPASDVRYLGPDSHQDLAGFVAPEAADDEPFVVAWIGGSEVKLREVSLAGEVANRIGSFGDRRVQLDAYTLIAPRPIDVLRAVDAAVSNGADAVVISINAVWMADDWSMREWSNLDVANIGPLAARPSLWPWALALTSPADVTWRITRALLPIVEAQNRLNERAQDAVDALDVLRRPDEGDPPPVVDPGADEGDPRLPADDTAFWLVEEYGPSILDDPVRRVARMVGGLDDDSPVADRLLLRVVRDLEAADIPAYLYVAPFSPEALADPELAVAAVAVEAYWRGIADRVTSPLVTIEPTQLTSEFADRADYFDLVHMRDAGPFADVLVDRLCANWQLAHPTEECS
jgi:hypothetical protein